MTASNVLTPRIALTGKLRSGKSMASTHLFVTYGFSELSFGTRLKMAADELFFNSSVYKSDDIERGGLRAKKPRKMYQDFGQAMRKLDDNIWIDHVESAMKTREDSRSTKGIVIDDLRQPNEYQWAKDNGFIIIRINAPDDVRRKRALSAGDDFVDEDLIHETESHVDTFVVDYEIDNDGGYAEFIIKFDEIVKDVIAKHNR